MKKEWKEKYKYNGFLRDILEDNIDLKEMNL